MIIFKAVLRVDIEIINTDWLIVLSQFNVVEICAFLIHVMNHNQVINHLKEVEILRDYDALGEFELIRWVQFMQENLSSLWRKMQHVSIVVQRCNEDLMFVSLVVETSWEVLIITISIIDLIFRLWQEHF